MSFEILWFRDFCHFLEGFGSKKLALGKKSLGFSFGKFGPGKKSIFFDFGKFGLGKSLSFGQNFGLIIQ